MTDQEQFYKAWANYSSMDDPRDRMKSVVKDRLDVNIMYIQASRILELYYTPPDKPYTADWELIKKEISELADDEVLEIYHDFIKKYKGNI